VICRVKGVFRCWETSVLKNIFSAWENFYHKQGEKRKQGILTTKYTKYANKDRELFTTDYADNTEGEGAGAG